MALSTLNCFLMKLEYINWLVSNVLNVRLVFNVNVNCLKVISKCYKYNISNQIIQ